MKFAFMEREVMTGIQCITSLFGFVKEFILKYVNFMTSKMNNMKKLLKEEKIYKMLLILMGL